MLRGSPQHLVILKCNLRLYLINSMPIVLHNLNYLITNLNLCLIYN